MQVVTLLCPCILHLTISFPVHAVNRIAGIVNRHTVIDYPCIFFRRVRVHNFTDHRLCGQIFRPLYYDRLRPRHFICRIFPFQIKIRRPIEVFSTLYRVCIRNCLLRFAVAVLIKVIKLIRFTHLLILLSFLAQSLTL